MKEIKCVSDDPQFKEASEAVDRCQLELLRVADRAAQIEVEILGIKETPRDDDQWTKFKVGDSTDTNSRGRVDALRAEQGDLQQRQVFLTEALEQGRAQLDAIRGRVSLTVCEFHRPAFAQDAKTILSHLKAICELEQQSRRRRADLERDGVVTGALPHNLFDLGSWDDPYGGRVQAYRHWLKQSYGISS